MDVTKKNFMKDLPLVFEAIEKSDFISFDTEFTGLSTKDGQVSLMESLPTRYSKIAEDIRQFGILQFGMTCFSFNSNTTGYDSATFCFYLMKKDTPGCKLTFLSCASSIKFLADNCLDFNKLFKDGINYTTNAEQKSLKSNVMELIRNRLEHSNDHSGYINELFKKQIVPFINEQMSDCSNGTHAETKDETVTNGNALCSVNDVDDLLERDILDVLHATSYVPRNAVRSFSVQHRYDMEPIRQKLILEYPCVDATLNLNKKEITVRVFANQKARDHFVIMDVLEDYYDSIGFSHVLTKILIEEKPLIGHNLILDLFHLTDKCIAKLPKELNDFRALFHDNFQYIYDTRHICADQFFFKTNKGTSLMELFNSHKDDFTPILTMEGYISYTMDEEPKLHDAGYDAFATGVAFIGLVRKLDLLKRPASCVISSPKIIKYRNKIHITKLFACNTIDLNDEDNCFESIPDHFCVQSNKKIVSPVEAVFTELLSPRIVKENDKCHYVVPNTSKEIDALDEILIKARKRAQAADWEISLVRPSAALPTLESSRIEAKSASGISCLDSSQSPYSFEYGSPTASLSNSRISMSSLVASSKLSVASPEFTPGLSRKQSSSSGTSVFGSPQFIPPASYNEFSTPVHQKPSHHYISKVTPNKNSSQSSVQNLETSFNSSPSIARSHSFSVPIGVESTDPVIQPMDMDISGSSQSDQTTVQSKKHDSHVHIREQQPQTSRRGEKRKSGDAGGRKSKPQNASSVSNENFKSNDMIQISNADATEEDVEQNEDEWIQVNRRKGRKTFNVKGSAQKKFGKTASSSVSDTTEYFKSNKRGRGKRSSSAKASDDSEQSDGGNSNPTTTPSPDFRRLKRLRSVGTSSMATLTLNSPTGCPPPSVISAAVNKSRGAASSDSEQQSTSSQQTKNTATVPDGSVFEAPYEWN